jgi:hypothetical protein
VFKQLSSVAKFQELKKKVLGAKTQKHGNGWRTDPGVGHVPRLQSVKDTST